MSAKEMKLIYESLLSSGDLEFLFPSMIGDWSIDKKEFIIQYNSNERVLSDINDGDDMLDDLDDLDFSEYY